VATVLKRRTRGGKGFVEILDFPLYGLSRRGERRWACSECRGFALETKKKQSAMAASKGERRGGWD